MEDRPKTIPELRGFKKIPEDRQAKYSAGSYVAQYGIPWNLADRLLGECGNHRQMDRRIAQLMADDPEMRERSIDGTDLAQKSSADPGRKRL